VLKALGRWAAPHAAVDAAAEQTIDRRPGYLTAALARRGDLLA